MTVIGVASERIEVGEMVAYDPETGHMYRASPADMTKDEPKSFVINELLMHPDSGQLLNFIRNEADGFCRCRSENGQTGLWRPETLVRVPRESIPVAKEFASNRPCDMMGHNFTSPEAMLYKRCSKCNWSTDSWEDFPDQRAACQGTPLPKDFGAWRHTCHRCRYHWHSMSENNACPRCEKYKEAMHKSVGFVPAYTCQTCQRVVTTTLNGACLACRQATMKEPVPLLIDGQQIGTVANMRAENGLLVADVQVEKPTSEEVEYWLQNEVNGKVELPKRPFAIGGRVRFRATGETMIFFEHLPNDCCGCLMETGRKRILHISEIEKIPEANLWPKEIGEAADKMIAEIEARGPMPKQPFALGERLRIKATGEKVTVWRIDKDELCCLVQSGAILRYSPDDLERYQIVMDTATTAGSINKATISTSTICAEGDQSGNAKFLNDMACPNHWTGGLTGVCPDCGKK